MRTVVEVELCDGQQNSGEGQVRAEPTEERLDAREGPVDQRGVLHTHAVQDTHRLHQALGEEQDQTGLHSSNDFNNLCERKRTKCCQNIFQAKSIKVLHGHYW